MVSERVVRGIAALQRVVQRDEGRRGITPLIRPGQLLAAAQLLLSPQRHGGVAVLTGFPCHRDSPPFIENDGPPGAAALVHTLVAVGRAPVVLPIEDYAAPIMRRSLAACAPSAPSVEVIGFPSAERWMAEDDARLDRLGGASSSLVCIERAGEASDGVCRTMRGLPMGAALLGHLNRLLDAAAVQSVAIGDGGNELGMGTLYEEICAAIPNGPLIGCSRAADVAVVASVSNWGGHALSCALALLAWDQGASSPIIDGLQGSADDARAFLGATVHTVEISRQVLHAVCEAGAVDGITRAANGDVDGLPLALQLEILDELLEIARVAMEESPRGAASP